MWFVSRAWRKERSSFALLLGSRATRSVDFRLRYECSRGCECQVREGGALPSRVSRKSSPRRLSYTALLHRPEESQGGLNWSRHTAMFSRPAIKQERRHLSSIRSRKIVCHWGSSCIPPYLRETTLLSSTGKNFGKKLWMTSNGPARSSSPNCPEQKERSSARSKAGRIFWMESGSLNSLRTVRRSGRGYLRASKNAVKITAVLWGFKHFPVFSCRICRDRVGCIPACFTGDSNPITQYKANQKPAILQLCHFLRKTRRLITRIIHENSFLRQPNQDYERWEGTPKARD